MFLEGRLSNGGIMVNYCCTAACRHCLYACSPERTKDYITADMAKKICRLLRRGGCHSVHIGGGEPFVNFEGLCGMVQALNEAYIGLDYIETNAFWAVPADEQNVRQKLRKLLALGVDALCISIDPYHAEYVPWERPLFLAEMCRQEGMGYFLWKQQFVRALSGLSADTAHTRGEMEQAISPNYLLKTAQEYGLRFGGRALNMEEEYRPRQPVEKLVNSKSCQRSLSLNHFHVDLFGNVLPGGCTGMTVPLEEIIEGIPEGKYPVYEAVCGGGTAALMELATARGFVPAAEGYTSTCGMCFHIRKWLAENALADCPELDAEYYEAAMARYSR